MNFWYAAYEKQAHNLFLNTQPSFTLLHQILFQSNRFGAEQHVNYLGTHSILVSRIQLNS